MNKIIYIFRHGQTDWNIDKRFQGHSDISLNINGRLQAQRLGDYLKSFDIEKIFSSDLSRAYETATMVAKHNKAPIEKTEILREAHLGELEGMLISDAKKKFGINVIDMWKSNEKKYLDMKLPGGETKRTMLARVNQYLEEVIHSEDLKRVGISTHGGVIHKLISHLLDSEHMDYPVTNCSLFVFEFSQEKYKFLEYKDFSKE